MRWACGLSEEKTLENAVGQCAAQVRAVLGTGTIDLAFIFVGSGYAAPFERVPAILSEHLEIRTLLGCSGGGIIGGGREIEGKPAVSLIAARLPQVTITPFHIVDETLPDLDAPPRGWEALVGVKPADDPQLILLADPITLRAEDLMLGLDYAYPKAAKVGGLTSAGSRPGENALFLNRATHREGAVGVALSGNITLDTLVTQGCRPIGAPLRVTDSREHVLMALDGKPPLHVLQDIAKTLSPRDKALVQHALFVGVVMDPMKEHPGHGDFLIRNIIGADMQRGLLAVGARLRPGQTVQYHLRDAQTSADDLHAHLARAAKGTPAPGAALLFSCLGRGQALYGKPDHDTLAFEKHLGPVPLAGFFCSGEIGPVGGTTYLHGYTSSFGLFRPKT